MKHNNAEIFLDGTWNDLPNWQHTFIAEVEEGGGSTGGSEGGGEEPSSGSASD